MPQRSCLGPVADLEQHLPAEWWRKLFNALYVKTDGGKFRWLANKSPGGETTSLVLASGIPAGKREYLLYLPLYNGVTSVEIGIPKATMIAKGPAYDEAHAKPIVFYGTSITHGISASRPGMVHTAILGRRLLILYLCLQG